MIIGITGTDGAGKGVVVDYLVKEKGYTHYSARALITEEIEKRGLPIDREHTRLVGNDMRREFGNDVIVRISFEKAKQEGIEKAIIESIRALAEVQYLKEQGGVLLAVDADQHLRYERIVGRGSETDNISFEEFQKQEAIEMNDPDPNGMQKQKVMAMANHTVLNEGTLEELHAQIDEVLQKINESHSQ